MSNEQIDFGLLGQGDSYAVYTEKFDSSLLNPMPRAALRVRFGIKGDEFIGYDIWHCHESTFLLNSGLPVAGTLKFIYPASSPFMVESKSMKLYLNSFDMCKMGETFEDAKAAYVNQIVNDLSQVVGSQVRANFFDSVAWDDWDGFVDNDIIGDCVNIAHFDQIYKTTFDDFRGENSGDQSYVTLVPRSFREGITGCYFTNVLRSRCRHTKQKDTGTAVLWHDPKEDWVVDPVSFLRQVISLREVNEFHELCAEKLFLDVRSKVPTPDGVTILLLYSRRGSLDINPVRSTDIDLIPSELLDVKTLTLKTQGQ